ncbi:MAG: hypothetical protein IJU00_05685 [Selenomonas sp.]|nr:hypothetical protein [Selenomonas sp.]
MATQSILKSVNIKGRKGVRDLVNALEQSEKNRGKEVTMSRTVYEVKGKEAIKDFFTKVK